MSRTRTRRARFWNGWRQPSSSGSQKRPRRGEKGFLGAVDVLFFGAGNYGERRTAYMKAMRALNERFPDDDEVAAFYALSLLSAAGPAGSRASALNVLGGAIGLEITARNPRHPGAVHYTIHAFDDPVHARLALPAARVFADIAGAVSHAQHMPTHIFIQLGMWGAGVHVEPVCVRRCGRALGTG